MMNTNDSLAPHRTQHLFVPAPAGRSLTARDVLRPLFRHGKAGLRTFLVIAALVAVGVFVWPRQYTAEMKILVKPDRLAAGVNAPEQPRPEVTDADVNSEVVLLQSRDLLRQVVLASGLVPPNARKDEVAISRAVRTLGRKLTVSPVRRADVIDLTYTATDPRTAAAVLSNLGRLYLEKHLNVNRSPGARAFFDQQAQRLREDLTAAQDRLVAFGKQHQVASAAGEKDSTLQKLADFQATLEQVRAQIADNTRRVTALRQEIATTPPRLTTMKRTQDNGDLMRDLKSKVLDLELKRTEMRTKFTATYPPVVELEKQLAQAREALASAERAPLADQTTDENPTYRWLISELARVAAECEALQARAGATEATIRDYQRRAMRLDEEGETEQDLIRAVKTAEDNYTLYQRKAEESRISDALDEQRIANVAIAEAPTLPALPSTRRALMLAAGLAVATVLALAAVFLLEFLDPRFRSRDEIETVLELPVLAAIPASVPR